jgi:hypothetical protein
MEIAHRADLEVQGLDALTGEVSVSFSRLPLRDAIKRLLDGVNYLILEKEFSKGGARPVLVQVFIPGGNMLSNLASFEINLEPDDGLGPLDRQEERLAKLRLNDSMGRTDEIQKAISERDPTVQEEAFELLARRDPHGAVNEALRATKSADLDTRLNALQVLQHRQQMDEWSTNAVLGEALSDQELAVREFAVQALAGREGPNVTLYLRNALRDPEPSVRRAVVESVAQKGNDFQLLYEALSDSDKSVRSLAVSWIEQLREGR